MKLHCPHCHGELTKIMKALEAEEKRKREQALQDMLAEIRARPDGNIDEFHRLGYGLDDQVAGS